jgi:hypothetical protein
MKVVRWLGAFRKASSLLESALWELTQTERQVAAEPLWRGRSLIHHARIGLVVDHQESLFRGGFISDAWTVTDDRGILRAKRDERRYRNFDRFLFVWNSQVPRHHGEVLFDATVFSAVAYKGVEPPRELAAALNLPVREVAFK